MALTPSILVVDDEPQIQRFLKPSLTAAGYYVAQALTAAYALKAIAEREYDLILVDLGLPDLDGKDLIRSIRQKKRDSHYRIVRPGGRKRKNRRP